MNYDKYTIKSYLEDAGAVWDQDAYLQFTTLINKHAKNQTVPQKSVVTQELHDEILKMYVDQVIRLAKPSNYSFIDRLKIAIYFLFRLK